MSVTIVSPQIDISDKIQEFLLTDTEEMGQVIVHVSVSNSSSMDTWIRIWPTTYLYDIGSVHKSELVHTEKIALYPSWQILNGGKTVEFMLVFSGLPSDCTKFDLIEHCTNQSGAFEVRSIHRNSTDVYYVNM